MLSDNTVSSTVLRLTSSHAFALRHFTLWRNIYRCMYVRSTCVYVCSSPSQSACCRPSIFVCLATSIASLLATLVLIYYAAMTHVPPSWCVRLHLTSHDLFFAVVVVVCSCVLRMDGPIALHIVALPSHFVGVLQSSPAFCCSHHHPSCRYASLFLSFLNRSLVFRRFVVVPSGRMYRRNV